MEEENIEPENENEDSGNASESKNGGISADLIRGHINTIILRTLYERDKYGYEIIEEIESKSKGQYSLKQPTLYSALKRLESQGYINAYWKTDEVSQGGRRKYYTLTDSGREVTERNQAEWEYSRTVIDNLISDKNFDFSQPAPSPVDFKLLKSTTSRIRTVKDTDDDDESDEGRIVNYEEPEKEQVVEIKREDATPVVITDAEKEQQTENLNTETEQSEPVQNEIPPEQVKEISVEEQELSEMTAEERQILHENYMRLISEPSRDETSETPYADSMDTDKLIYNNRPETERDYRNLINNLFTSTLRDPSPTPQYQSRPQVQPKSVEALPAQPSNGIIVEKVRVDDATAKSSGNTNSLPNASDYSVGNRKKKYNRGTTMFKCALIIGIVMLLEFALCIIFRNELGVSLAYPFVIFAIACAEVLIFGVLCYTDIGKSSRKPTTLIYLSACIIIAVIAILMIFVFSLLLNVNFASAGDIMAKIVIPCFIALNIPLFGLLFYLFSK